MLSNYIRTSKCSYTVDDLYKGGISIPPGYRSVGFGLVPLGTKYLSVEGEVKTHNTVGIAVIGIQLEQVFPIVCLYFKVNQLTPYQDKSCTDQLSFTFNGFRYMLTEESIQVLKVGSFAVPVREVELKIEKEENASNHI